MGNRVLSPLTFRSSRQEKSTIIIIPIITMMPHVFFKKALCSISFVAVWTLITLTYIHKITNNHYYTLSNKLCTGSSYKKTFLLGKCIPNIIRIVVHIYRILLNNNICDLCRSPWISMMMNIWWLLKCIFSDFLVHYKS